MRTSLQYEEMQRTGEASAEVLRGVATASLEVRLESDQEILVLTQLSAVLKLAW